jgi:hypothetical protein
MSKKTETAKVVAPVLDAAQAAQCATFAATLATADAAFESAIVEVATNVARVIGTKPTFTHWELVRDAFVTAYAKARNCKEESARRRWVGVCDVMAKEFALEKPAKPTEAGVKKAEQRKDADTTAAELCKAQNASSAQAIMEIASKTPGLSRSVVAALGKKANEAAQQSQKNANEAAKEVAKAMRESLRKTAQALGVDQLREVTAFIAARQAAGWKPIEAPKDPEGDKGAPAEGTLQTEGAAN